MGKAICLACLALLASTNAVLTVKKIEIDHGRILNREGLNCSFMINGTVVKSNGQTIPGIYYGLIIYDCGIENGYLLSTPECLNCGLYCPQNDMLVKCQQMGVPVTAGVIIGIIFFVIIGLLLYITRKYWFQYPIDKYHNIKNKRKQKKITKIDTRVIYLNNRKDPLDMNPCKPIYMELKNNTPPSPPPRAVTPNAPAMSTGRALMYAAMLSTTTVHACDQTLYLKGNGMVCDTNGCQQISTYSLNINYERTICFQHETEGLFKYKMRYPKAISDYQLLYRTSDFLIHTESRYSCKGSGDCWYGGCSPSVGDKFMNKNRTLETTGCRTSTLGCESYCFHGTACTWYTNWLELLGNPVDIYKISVTKWEFEIYEVHGTVIKLYKFDSDRTDSIFINSKLFGTDDTPIMVSSVMMPEYHKDHFIAVDGINNYFVHAAPLNFPQSGMIGDLQIDLYNSSIKYDSSGLECLPDNCQIECTYPPTAVQTLRGMPVPKSLHTVHISKNGKVTSSRPSPISAIITLGNVNYRNLFVQKAECNINLDFSYGCIACDENPYVIYTAINIKSEGTMKFESNCSFNTDHLTCSTDPMVLHPADRYNRCKLWIMDTNDTLFIDFKYEFVGKMTNIDRTFAIDNSAYGIAKSIMDNPNFFSSLMWSFTSMSLIAVALGVLSKIISRIILIRSAKEIERVV
ncbi:MAG: glycoprotein [hymenopteran phasma-related virus OKIAV227]|uniref:glycoprotein n=1 Tax=hymenopteran phasma-related virus OKIAV227 TaxID=2847799 RepID=UPI002484666A|nr:MAG: glycoprotein [hymenopteran phasma-related virus OKIAV227]WBM84616.1 MAG: glycoprotein [hymenopteran phasma-related virus OKIAV227]